MPVMVDVQSREEYAFVSPGEFVAISKVSGALADSPDTHIDDTAWIARARNSWEDYPVEVRRVLRDFRRFSGATGALLLRGLPVNEGKLRPTPTVANSVQRTVTTSAAMLIAFACGLGDPSSFHGEKGGALVQDVVPVPGMRDFQGNAGSSLLPFHNENAFHPYRPDYVLLLCLRDGQDRSAALRTVCVRGLLPMLTPMSRESLSRAEFVTAPPPSFGNSAAPTQPHAVLGGAFDDPDIRVDLAATEPLTKRAEEAFVELREALDRASRLVHLSPGDLAIVDNRVTVHGRTAFEPQYDGSDRWIQRTFVAADIRRSRAYRPGDSYVLIPEVLSAVQ